MEMKMTPVILLPGSTYERSSLWPLYVRHQSNKPFGDRFELLPMNYKRGRKGVPNELLHETDKVVLRKETRRVHNQILEIVKTYGYPVHVIAHSRGANIAYNLVHYHADLARRGLVHPDLFGKVALVNCGVIGGPVKFGSVHFYYSQKNYLYKLLLRPDSLRRQVAIRRIQREIDHFSYKLPRGEESIPAMLESVHGAIPVQNGFPINRIRNYVGEEDTVIPLPVALTVAERTGWQLEVIPRFGHDIPLTDVKGRVLEKILTWFTESP